MNRRLKHRVPVSLMVNHRERHSAEAARILNLSASGMLVELWRDPLQLTGEVDVTFELPGLRSVIHAVSEVRRVIAGTRAGVRFRAMAAHDWYLLKTYVDSVSRTLPRIPRTIDDAWLALSAI